MCAQYWNALQRYNKPFSKSGQQSTRIYINLHLSTWISTRIYTNLHQSTRICTNLHESTQSRFKALQALFLADIAHYNYKCSCGLSKGLKMLASMILSPLSKVVLEAWGKCVLGYTLLPNCCAENGLHPCIIFQVGKPNTPQSSFSGVATIPKQAWQIDFCVHKSTTCYSQEKGKSKKSLHALKALFCRSLSTPNPQGGFVQISPWHTINPQAMEGAWPPTP